MRPTSLVRGTSRLILVRESPVDAARRPVFGAGPVGLLCMTVAKALGARNVLAVDIQQARLEFAKQYAADDFHLPSKPQEGEERLTYSRRNVSHAHQLSSIALLAP